MFDDVLASPWIDQGIHIIDTKLGGWTCCTAGYLISGANPVLIEVGSKSSAAEVIGQLNRLGIGPNDLAGIVVTHIHLDHAGGVGDLARAFPRAKIYVHPVGARHLASPERLLLSAERVFGPLLDSLFGRLDPTEPQRIYALSDGEQINIGNGRFLTTIHSPGHASHHLGMLDSESGVIFVGDAFGVHLPEVDVVRPATPPPDFDLELSLSSLGKFKTFDPMTIAFAHFGIDERVDEMFERSIHALTDWATSAARAYVQLIGSADGDPASQSSAMYGTRARSDIWTGEIASARDTELVDADTPALVDPCVGDDAPVHDGANVRTDAGLNCKLIDEISLQEAVGARLLNELDVGLSATPESYQRKVNALVSTKSNAAGLSRWLQTECGQIWLSRSS